MVVRRVQIRRAGWVVKKIEAQVGQFLLGCKCAVSRGIFVPEQDRHFELPAAFFLQNVLKLHQHRCVILRVHSVTLWNINDEEAAFLIPISRGEIFSRRFLHSEFYEAG